MTNMLAPLMSIPLLFIGLSAMSNGNVWNNSTSSFELVIGVYGPDGGPWMKSILERWYQMRSSTNRILHPDMSLYYINSSYSLKFKDIASARSLLQKNEVSVVIGPGNEALTLAAASLHIPYFILSPPMTSSNMVMTSSLYGHQAIYHMWPSMTLHHLAVCDVVSAYGMREAAVIYIDDLGLRLVGELMTIPHLVVRSYLLDLSDVTHLVRHYLLRIRQLGIRQIIVITNAESLNAILSEALRLSMMSNYYRWILADLFSCDLDFSPYNYTQVNMTVISLGLTPKIPEVSLISRLTHDALHLITKMAAAYTSARIYSCLPGKCQKKIRGANLIPLIANVSLNGLTGRVQFDTYNGFRTDISMELLTLTENGLVRKGEWISTAYSRDDRLKLFAVPKRKKYVGPHPFGKEPLNIVIMLDAPFVLKRKNWWTYEGNDRYEGFLVDLIRGMSTLLKFEYVLYESPDGNYGSQQDGEWNGMIRELIEGNASMCLGAISITSERETAVDFTKPFMQKTFNILIKKPLEKTSPFQFLWPFSPRIWTISLTVVLLVSLLLFLMDRFSPNFDETRFTLYESLWFIYGSLVGPGTEMFPRTVSSRILSAAWWFFSLILVSSYTANLAAHLTVTRIETPIKTIMDLASQTQLKYGTVRDTYAHSFFRNSKLDEIKKMWTYMNEVYPDTMVENTSVGIAKVKEGNFAFIWDAPINRYTAMYECDTMAVGEPFDEKGLGIGVPLGAPYRDELTMAILSLQEDGITQKLIERWWGGGKCMAFQESSTSRTKELDLANIAGVFLVLAGGAAVAIIACIMEVSYHRVIKVRKLNNKSLGQREQDHSIHMTDLSNSNSYQNR